MHSHKSKNYTVEAFVIRRSDYAEADRIVTLFTPTHGKIQTIVKGAKKTGSRMSAYLEMLSYVKVFLARGRNLDVITQIEPITKNPLHQGNLDMISCQFYIAEVVNQVATEGEENFALFHLVRQVVERLKNEPNREGLLCYFELQLLSVLGYRPDFLGQDPHPPLHELPYMSTLHGGLIPSNGTSTAGGALRISLDSWDCLHQLHQSHSVLPRYPEHIWEEVRTIVHALMSQITDRTMRSLSFRQEVRAF